MSNRLAILVFIDWYTPGYKAGGPITSMVRMAAKVPFDFYIVTSIFDHHTTVPYDVPANTWIRRSDNEQVMYVYPKEFTRSAIHHLIRERTYDRYYLNSLFSAVFTLRPLLELRRLKLDHRAIIAPRGMLKSGALSIKRTKKRAFLTVTRLTGIFKRVRWHSTSEEETQEIGLHYPGAHIRLARNLTGTTCFSLAPPVKEPGTLRLITIARVSAEKNILGAAKALAGLNGAVEWNVYGVIQDRDYMEQCLDALRNSSVGVHFHGDIHPSGIVEALHRHHFFYLLTFGENFGHAIAESLLTGTPVIISNRTPWHGLDEEPCGIEIPLDAPDISNLLTFALEMNQEEYTRYKAGAEKRGLDLANDASAVTHTISLFQ